MASAIWSGSRSAAEGRRMATFQREGWGTVTPRIVTPDVDGLAQFLRAVFEARGECPAGAPAEMRIGDSTIMISEGMISAGMISEGGDRREAVPAFLYVYVADADRSYAKAIGLGAVS